MGNKLTDDQCYIGGWTNLLVSMFPGKHCVVYGGDSDCWSGCEKDFEHRASMIRTAFDFAGAFCISGQEIFDAVNLQKRDFGSGNHVKGTERDKLVQWWKHVIRKVQ